MNLSDLQNKDLINIIDGKKIGLFRIGNLLCQFNKLIYT